MKKQACCLTLRSGASLEPLDGLTPRSMRKARNTPLFTRLPRLLAALALLTGLWVAPALSQAANLAIGEGQLLRISKGEASTVFVADPQIADVQVPANNAVLVMGRRAGSTTLYVLDADGAPLLQQRIDVRHNTEALQSVLRQRFPNQRITAESAPGSLLIGGSVPDAQTADAVARTVQAYLGENDQLINQLAIASPTQVHLRVRVTEVSRAVTQQLGVNWSVIASPAISPQVSSVAGPSRA